MINLKLQYTTGFKATRITQAQQNLFIFPARWQCRTAYVYRIACAFHHCKKKEEKEGVGKAMMGREVNSIATAREKCRQLLWQAALQLYVELRPSADGCPSVCPFPAPAAALHSSLVEK